MIHAYVLVFLWFFTLPIQSWVLYTALMHMDKLDAEDLLEPEAKMWAKRLLLIGYPMDFILNLTWGQLYLRSWARELTLTAHLNRLVLHGTEAQKARALHIRTVWLNNFDKRGVHT